MEEARRKRRQVEVSKVAGQQCRQERGRKERQRRQVRDPVKPSEQ